MTKFLVCFNYSDDCGYSALHVAAEVGSISNVKLLVLDDAELVKQVNKSDQTALHVACKNGYKDIVSLLLKSGANPLAREKNGCTALECAIEHKQHGVVKELLQSDSWKTVSPRFYLVT